jgi:hypothetical protein
MDVFLPECRYLPPGLKFTARIKPWSKALAIPEDGMTYLLEIMKFLGTVAMIAITGLILLLAG